MRKLEIYELLIRKIVFSLFLWNWNHHNNVKVVLREHLTKYELKALPSFQSTIALNGL